MQYKVAYKDKKRTVLIEINHSKKAYFITSDIFGGDQFNLVTLFVLRKLGNKLSGVGYLFMEKVECITLKKCLIIPLNKSC